MTKVNEVFVAGGQPSVTYVPRSSANLENALTRAIAKGYHLISLTGPTKVGKTVLCKRIISSDSGIWMTGGEVNSEQEFWESLSYKLDLFVEKKATFDKSKEESTKITGSVVALKSEKDFKERYSKSESITYSISSKVACLEKLMDSNKYLIIDDFHYLTRETH